ncbi:MAG: diguanylate cyclase [Deltaproteobacteria bacterium]|jgi:diguanylate cyclase (GGDEF)-like protein|nr:diguanylate cyclase [Deltaproteobacteria bacterium]
MSMTNVVVIDEDPKNLHRVARGVRPFGFGILWAENLADGLELISEARPLIVVVASDLTGLESPVKFLEKVESANISTQVVVLAKDPELDVALDWVAQGVTAVLTRPLNPDKLRQAVTRIVENRDGVRLHPGTTGPQNDKSLILYRNLAGQQNSRPLMESLANTARSLTGATRAEVWSGEGFSPTNRLSSGADQALNSYELCLEMPWRGRSLATLKLSFASQKAIEDLDPTVLHELQWVGALFLNQAQCYEAAVRMASRDPLTGLFNRRIFLEQLDREFYQSQRHGSPLSLIILDLDRFKKINDTYGHQVGDGYLKWLADTVDTVSRAGDVTARIGGEEFAILLPRTELDQALVLANRLKEALANNLTPEGLPGVRPTISQGVADNGHFLIKSPADLVYWSDQAMYLAKRSGRDAIKTLADLPGQRKIEDAPYAFQ